MRAKGHTEGIILLKVCCLMKAYCLLFNYCKPHDIARTFRVDLRHPANHLMLSSVPGKVQYCNLQDNDKVPYHFKKVSLPRESL